MSYDVALIGSGMTAAQFTLEHVETLKEARHIFSAQGVDDPTWAYLSQFPAQLHDLHDMFYHDGADKLATYRAIAERVIEYGAREGQTAFVQYGHPLIFSTPSAFVIQQAAARGLTLRLMPGISSIDQILCILELEIAVRGLQIVGGALIASGKVRVDPAMDLLIMAPGRLADPLIARTPRARPQASQDAYARLQGRLEEIYPASHEVLGVRASASDSHADLIAKATIGTIAQLGVRVGYEFSFYVKGIEA